jgi:hypothetical protein
VGRPHPARGRLRHDRRARVLGRRIGIGDRVDPPRLAGGRLALLARAARQGSNPGHPRGPPGSPLFVGIGRSSDVDRYLAGVNHTVISDFFGNKVKAVGGGPSRSAPGTQRFWVASSSGPGARTLKWNPHGGSWTVVVMNADARPGIGVRADLGARFPAVLWIAIGLLIAGAVFVAGGGLLIAGAIRGRRATRAGAGVEAGRESAAAAVHDDGGRSHAEH